MTERLYLEEPTLVTARARVVAVSNAGVVLDRTTFYPRGGGQPGDIGNMFWDGGDFIVVDAIKGDENAIVHVPAPNSDLPPVGATVEIAIDWVRRRTIMRMHTTLHLLCAVLPGAAVTGGSIAVERSRLDFDLPEPPPKELIEERLNALIAGNHPVTTEWVDETVLDTNPELVRTLSVKPPRGSGRVRLVRIGSAGNLVDLQPCGGTHVANTSEIGRMAVQRIENKGKQNRRITVIAG